MKRFNTACDAEEAAAPQKKAESKARPSEKPPGVQAISCALVDDPLSSTTFPACDRAGTVPYWRNNIISCLAVSYGSSSCWYLFSRTSSGLHTSCDNQRPISCVLQALVGLLLLA